MTNKFTESYAPPCIIDDNGKFRSLGSDKGASDYHDELLEYIQTGLNNEKAFLRSCRAYKKAEIGMAVLYGDNFRKDFKGPSTLQIKKSRRQTREAIANQSDIRQNWQVRTNKPDDLLCQDQANDYNKLSKDWWGRLFVDRTVKGAQQYAGGHGTGYIFMWPEYDTFTDEIDIIPTYLDYKSVLVGHIPPDNDIQKCYRLDIRLEMPLPLAHERWPDHIGIIKADTEIPSRLARNFDRGKKVYKGLWDWMGRKKKRDAESSISNPFPCANIFMTFIKDNSTNESGEKVCMGEVGSHWYYEVPSYFDKEGNVNKVGTGTFNGENQEVMRNLKRTDCKLFPNRRLVISCSGGIIYDGPPQWGDGTLPVSQCYFDKVAGEFLAFPVAMDSISIENSVNNIFQAMEDSILGRINPPIGIDNSVPDTIANTIKAKGIRGLIGQGFKYSVQHLQKAIVPLIAAEYFVIGADTFKLVELLQGMQDYTSGTQDWASAAQLKQTPSDDTQEALLRKLGVLSTDQARDQEKFFMEMGRIWLSFADQVYTLKRRLQIIGADALKPEYIDYDPSKLEQVYKNDSRPRWIVRREHKKNFSIFVSPNSVQERQSMQNKLALLQIQKMGAPISDKRIYDTFVGDDNFEKERDQYYADLEEKAVRGAKIQAEVQKVMQAAGLSQSGKDNASGIDNPLIQQVAEQLVAQLSNNQSVGRPPTNNAPARLEQKMRDGVPDSTLATN